ncbi:hypothetical protein ACG873_18175 [Mesorhizobium sp. AaZ16]|uniref:hypothetical protein n=1 Tax=Mesorhizobium sp. AaZ16 TaxID=3402289 RepID=UPI00374E944C
MKRFTQAVRLALANGNSYSALLTALALPDICGGLENPKQGSKDRYVGWARQWIEPVYTVQFNVWEGPAFDAWEAERPLRPTFTFPSSYEDYGRYQEDRDRRQAAYEAEYEAWSNRRPKRPSLFLPAEDLYALRCAMLHSGSDNAEEQRAAQTLKRYCFIAPGPYTVHNNSGLDDRGNRVLQLQVDIFCKDIADKVDEWDTTVAGNAAIQSRKERELVWIITPDMTEQWHSRFGLGGSSGLPRVG